MERDDGSRVNEECDIAEVTGYSVNLPANIEVREDRCIFM